MSQNDFFGWSLRAVECGTMDIASVHFKILTITKSENNQLLQNTSKHVFDLYDSIDKEFESNLLKYAFMSANDQ